MIQNLNKIIRAKAAQMGQNFEDSKDNKEDPELKEILGLIFKYLQENNTKIFDMLRAVADNQKLLKAQLTRIEEALNINEENKD